MIAPKFFKESIVDFHVSTFLNNRSSLALAFSACWSIDAFASHVAMAVLPSGQKPNRSYDSKFKERLEEIEVQQMASHFKIVRAISNAAKHAVRSGDKNLFSNSGALRVETMNGFLMLGEDYDFWGAQIIVEPEILFVEADGAWHNSAGHMLPGILHKWIPVASILQPSIKLIEDEYLASGA